MSSSPLGAVHVQDREIEAIPKPRSVGCLAVLCMTPDPGHLIPLLKIAAYIREHVREVQIIVPDELQHMAALYGVQCHTFGAVKPNVDYACVEAYLRASGIARLLKYNRLLHHEFLIPLMRNVRNGVDKIRDLLDVISPTIILADEHIFSRECIRLAEGCGVPILLHKITAHLELNTDTFSFGSIDAPDLRYLVRDFGKAISGELKFLGRRLISAKAGRRRLEFERSIFCGDSFVRNGNILKIASGTSLLEKLYLSDVLKLDQQRFVVPLLPSLQCSARQETYDWLNNGHGDVIYISFGTVVVPSPKLLNSLIKEFVSRGKRVLVQTPAITEYHKHGLVRYERWVSQPTVLANAAVKLFVSHSGAGALQEAIWAGQPMLCIPHGFDHYYCAWVARELGVGMVLNGHRFQFINLIPKKVGRLFSELPSMAKRAQQLSMEVRSHLHTWNSRDLWKDLLPAAPAQERMS